MLTMFQRPSIGISLSSKALRMGVLSPSRGTPTLLASAAEPLTSGMITESYAARNIADRDGLAAVLTKVLGRASNASRRVGLALPDSIARVQIFDFDELPAGTADRDRLVRWRLEKGAAFDMTSTTVRYQVIGRTEKGSTVLACVMKSDILAEYESLVVDRGLEPWSVGLASFQALNFYSPVMADPSGSGFTFVWIADGAYVTIVMDRGGPRFYRSREIKGGPGADAAGRLTGELEDSIHFYTHLDRQQQADISRLYLAGDGEMTAAVAEGMQSGTTMDVRILQPQAVIPSAGNDLASVAPAFGAGGAV